MRKFLRLTEKATDIILTSYKAKVSVWEKNVEAYEQCLLQVLKKTSWTNGFQNAILLSV